MSFMSKIFKEVGGVAVGMLAAEAVDLTRKHGPTVIKAVKDNAPAALEAAKGAASKVKGKFKKNDGPQN